jgi:FAD/FMN-containing dehydrogenase
MSTTSTVDRESVAELSSRFSGVLLLPGDVGYDQARHIHNGLIDKRPALIARCLGTADVVDAVKFARAGELEAAVRGGHNVAGKAVCDGGLMLDLSTMKGIHVDPERGTVRAQGGVTWREFNRATQLHGLASTGGVVSTTGIAGRTLGGGLGWLMGKHGLALDNLLSVELVTASGDVVRASEKDNGDLFWALRGAGANFGVASWLEYRLHPVGPVTSGFVAYPMAQARDVWRFVRDTCRRYRLEIPCSHCRIERSSSRPSLKETVPGVHRQRTARGGRPRRRDCARAAAARRRRPPGLRSPGRESTLWPVAARGASSGRSADSQPPGGG